MAGCAGWKQCGTPYRVRTTYLYSNTPAKSDGTLHPARARGKRANWEAYPVQEQCEGEEATSMS